MSAKNDAGAFRFRRPYFRLIEVLNNGLLRAETRYGAQLWSTGKQRKSGKRCWLTDASITPGQVTWRPVTNAENRGHRILADAMLTARATPEERG